MRITWFQGCNVYVTEVEAKAIAIEAEASFSSLEAEASSRI